MAQAIVGRWGRNLAVRLPVDVARAAGLNEGERVEIQAHDGDLVIRRATPRFTLDDLFKGKSDRQWRAEYAASSEHLWPDVGREIVDD